MYVLMLCAIEHQNSVFFFYCSILKNVLRVCMIG